MPAIILFQKDNKTLPIADLSDALAASFGVFCFSWKENRKIPAEELKGEARNLTEGQLWVELPDLQPEEGAPVVTFEITPRLDRASDMQELIDQILEQDSSLRKLIDKNQRDILITAEDTEAGIQAANAVAFAIAEATGSGLLLPGLAEDEETLWFDSADDFAEAVFDVSDDDDDEDEDDEELEEDEDEEEEDGDDEDDDEDEDEDEEDEDEEDEDEDEEEVKGPNGK